MVQVINSADPPPHTSRWDHRKRAGHDSHALGGQPFSFYQMWRTALSETIWIKDDDI